MPDDLARVLILAVLCWAALAGAAVAGHERGRSRSWLTTHIGAGIVAVHLIAGTIKADRFDVPVDWVTWIGLAGLIVLGAGFTTTAVQAWRRGQG